MATVDDRDLLPINGPDAQELVELVSGKINVQTGTSYTIQASDWGALIQMTNSSPNSVTIPAGLPDYFWCTVLQSGTGQTTIVQGSGASVLVFSSQMKLAGQGADCFIRRLLSADSYYMSGNTVP